MPQPPAVVVEARNRRRTSAAAGGVRFEWFIREVSDKVAMALEERVRLATAHLLSAVVQNISSLVTKSRGPRGGHVVTDRSRPGEFPKADTTQLMKTTFSDVQNFGNGVVDGYVGTPLDYGLILETQMNRSFLVRSLNEENNNITRILTGPLA